MRFRLFFAAAAAALAVLTACSRPSFPASSGPQGEDTPQAAAVSPELAGEMLSMANLYELYAGGADYTGFGENGTPISYAFGWLKEAGFAERYLDGLSLSYAIPYSALEEVAVLFFGPDPAPGWDKEQVLNYSSDYPTDQDRLTLAVQSCEPDGDRITMEVDRFFDGEPLYPAVYTFEQVQPEALPEIAKDAALPDGRVLRIVEVKNLYEGQATLEDREISSVDDLVAMSEAINSGDRSAQQARYLLTQDLDLSGVSLSPIGSNRTLIPFGDHRDPTRAGFNAVFDGQGHTLRNLSLSVTAQSQAQQEGPYDPTRAGLFARIGGHGAVMNLTLENASVSIQPGEGEEAQPGPAGLLAGTIEGTVTGCRVQGTVDGWYEVGGFAGEIGGYDIGGASVSRCYADVKVTGMNTVGGFAGMLHGSRLEDCAVTGTATTTDRVEGGMPGALGGFAGHAVGQRRLSRSFSSVAVRTTVPTRWVGGFLGGCEGIGGAVTSCGYDQTKAPGWEAIDYVAVHDGGAPPEVEALPSAGCRAAIEAILSGLSPAT